MQLGASALQALAHFHFSFIAFHALGFGIATFHLFLLHAPLVHFFFHGLGVHALLHFHFLLVTFHALGLLVAGSHFGFFHGFVVFGLGKPASHQQT